jgi:hypothetical protein
VSRSLDPEDFVAERLAPAEVSRAAGGVSLARAANGIALSLAADDGVPAARAASPDVLAPCCCP